MPIGNKYEDFNSALLRYDLRADNLSAINLFINTCLIRILLMYVKLTFKERTLARCMSLNLLYMLEKEPEIIDTLPSGVVANKQTRIPDAPELNDMFGAFNACHYDYYVNCDDASKETISRVIKALLEADDGKLPQLQADAQYLEDNQNLVVYAFTFALNELQRDKTISNPSLLEKLKNALIGEVQKHETDSMRRFFSMFQEEDAALPPDLNASETTANRPGQ